MLDNVFKMPPCILREKNLWRCKKFTDNTRRTTYDGWITDNERGQKGNTSPETKKKKNI